MQGDSFPSVLEPLSFLGCHLVLTREVENILLILRYILREHFPNIRHCWRRKSAIKTLQEHRGIAAIKESAVLHVDNKWISCLWYERKRRTWAFFFFFLTDMPDLSSIRAEHPEWEKILRYWEGLHYQGFNGIQCKPRYYGFWAETWDKI